MASERTGDTSDKLGQSLEALIKSGGKKPAGEAREGKQPKAAKSERKSDGKAKTSGPARTGKAAVTKRAEAAKPFKERRGKSGPVPRRPRAASEEEPDTWTHDRAPTHAPIRTAAGKRGGGGAGGGFAAAAHGGAVAHGAAVAAGGARPPIKVGTPVMVTNLDPSITAEDIRAIFSAVGEIRTVTVHFDSKGVSRGAADIMYRHRADAEAAVREFDGREVDNARIRVRIIGDSGAGAAATAAAAPVRRGRGHSDADDAEAAPRFKVTLTSAPPAAPRPTGMFSNLVYTKDGGSKESRPASAPRGGHDGDRGRGRGRGGRGAARGGRGSGGERRARAPSAGADDLDAQLDSYMAASAE